MKPLTRTVLVSVAALAAAPALAVTGEEVLENACAACHVEHEGGRWERIDAARKTPEGWDMTVTRMMRNHGVALEPEERAAVVRYLSDARGLTLAETEERRYILEREPVAWGEGPADPSAYRTGLLTMDLESGEMAMREVRIMDVFYFSTAVNPAKTRAFGAYNVLESFDLEKNASIRRVPLPHSYHSVNVSTDGSTVWLGGALGDLAAYDAETLEKKGQVDLPGNASMSLASVRLFTRDE